MPATVSQLKSFYDSKTPKCEEKSVHIHLIQLKQIPSSFPLKMYEQHLLNHVLVMTLMSHDILIEVL